MQTSVTIPSSIAGSVDNIAASSGFAGYLLAEIECGIIRAKLWQNDLTAIGIALKSDLISADDAIEHLADCGALRLIASAATPISS
jgi:hypothetical protein